VLVAVVLLPLGVGLLVLARPRWYPLNDVAQMEMRVRDVGSADPPLLGLVGRMHNGDSQGSHPGPLGFYLLWPVHRLLGGTSFGLLVATVWVHALAAIATVWIAVRRSGPRLALLVATALAVLVFAYGPEVLTVAWNPYLPLLWWIAFLLAVWSVLDDDLALLPVVVLAGSLAAQTHIGYLGTTAGLTALAVTWSLVRARRRGTLGLWARWALVAAVIGAIVWLPPVIEQFTEEPGNATIVWRYLSEPDEPTVGLGRAARVVLVQANPWRLVTSEVRHELGPPGDAEAPTVEASPWPGALLLAAEAVAVLVAWRLRSRRLGLLHLVLIAALLLEVVNVSRVFGIVWYYLVLWAWGTTALLLAAIVATAATAVRTRPGVLRAGTAAVAGALASVTLIAAIDASSSELNEPPAPDVLHAVVPPTVHALAATHDNGPYLVTWTDPMYLGSQGWALTNELHRAGFDVGTDGLYHGGLERYRRITAGRAVAEVHLAVGRAAVEQWRRDRTAEEVASFDPRNDEEDAEYARLRSEVSAGLRASGHADLVPTLDVNLPYIGLDASVPKPVRDEARRMSELGAVTAVFISPPHPRP
jgi:hypothetical protein